MGLSKVPGLSTCHTSPVRAKRWAGVGEFRAEGRSAALLLFQRPPFAGLFCLCLCRELWRRDRRIRARLSLSTCSSSLQQHVSAGTEGLWHFSCKTQHRESMGWALLACRGTLGPAWAVLSRGCRKKGSVWLSLVSWGLSPWAWFPPWACNTSSASGPWAKHCPRGPGPSGCAQLFSPMGALMPCLTPAWSLFPPGPGPIPPAWHTSLTSSQRLWGFLPRHHLRTIPVSSSSRMKPAKEKATTTRNGVVSGPVSCCSMSLRSWCMLPVFSLGWVEGLSGWASIRSR